MAVQKKKQHQQKRNMRRSHDRVQGQFNGMSNCGELKWFTRCRACGFYNKREINKKD